MKLKITLSSFEYIFLQGKSEHEEKGSFIYCR